MNKSQLTILIIGLVLTAICMHAQSWVFTVIVTIGAALYVSDDLAWPKIRRVTARQLVTLVSGTTITGVFAQAPAWIVIAMITGTGVWLFSNPDGWTVVRTVKDGFLELLSECFYATSWGRACRARLLAFPCVLMVLWAVMFGGNWLWLNIGDEDSRMARTRHWPIIDLQNNAAPYGMLAANWEDGTANLNVTVRSSPDHLKAFIESKQPKTFTLTLLDENERPVVRAPVPYENFKCTEETINRDKFWRLDTSYQIACSKAAYRRVMDAKKWQMQVQ